MCDWRLIVIAALGGMVAGMTISLMLVAIIARALGSYRQIHY